MSRFGKFLFDVSLIHKPPRAKIRYTTNRRLPNLSFLPPFPPVGTEFPDGDVVVAAVVVSGCFLSNKLHLMDRERKEGRKTLSGIARKKCRTD